MPADLTTRKLTALCQHQHANVLNLLSHLIETQGRLLSTEDRLQTVRLLRQRLSRHIQIERHALFPPLRQQAAQNTALSLQIDQLEQGMATILPDAILFLHRAERNPDQPYAHEARVLYRRLKAQFELEEKQLYPLFCHFVPVWLEEKQMRLFRQRLQLTVSRSSKTSPVTRIPQSLQSSAAMRRPTAEEMDRQAITRPVRRGEVFSDPDWDHSPFRHVPMMLAT
jgi:hypothetical protein